MTPPPPSAESTTPESKSLPIIPKEAAAIINVTSSQQPDAEPLHFLNPPIFTDKLAERAHIKRTLACAFRIFARYGFDEGVAGHITARDPQRPDCFWVNPFGMHFSLIKASDLILVDHSGKVIDGGENRTLNTAAFKIHGAVHVARPEIVCAAHSHTIYGRTWSAMGRELEMLTQDSCAFWRDHVVYNQFRGVVLGTSEGKEIAAKLGNKKAAILMNHGLLTVGRTIEEAIFWFVSLEKCCQTQLLADAAAAGRGYQTIKIGDEEAEFTYKIVGSPSGGYFSGKALFQKMFKEEGKEFDDES